MTSSSRCAPLFRRGRRLLAAAACALSLGAAPACGEGAADPPSRVLVIVIDGLRSDYITPELMPILYRLGEEGVRAEAHHAVYPTLTRVNAATLATGAYPEAHGLMHNTIYLPEVDDRPIGTYDAEDIVPATDSLGGALLTAVSAGEWLERNGKTLFVGSSGSTGSSFILNHRGTGGGVWNARGFVYPDSMVARAITLFGQFQTKTSAEQNAWMVEAYGRYTLDRLRPDLAILWITDPDGTAHQHGPGAPETAAALRVADQTVGGILRALEERGLAGSTNVIVTTDHGFSTDTGGYEIAALLSRRGLDDGVKVVGGDQIYVEAGGQERVRRIVEALQADPGVGAIFTRPAGPGEPLGRLPGTLSLDLVRYGHARAADILASPAWSDSVNRYGFAGTTTRRGAAGHGSTSPHEVQTTLIARGPGFKERLRSQVPSGNVDVLPTALRLLGIEPPPSAQGRALEELLDGGPDPATVRVGRRSFEASSGGYRVVLETVSAAGAEYVHQAAAVRR